MLEIKPLDKMGRCEVRLGNHRVTGRYRASKTVDGYMTIHLPIEPYVLRVPIDWIQTLEQL